MKFRLLSSVVAFVVIGSSCAKSVPIDVRRTNVIAESSDFASRGDFAGAIDALMPLVDAGDPEAKFTAGILVLQIPAEPSVSSAGRYSQAQGISWISAAARAGLPQAAAFLRNAFELGRYGFPKSAAFAACWRSVELGQRSAVGCPTEQVE